jgi:hypothetical protein
MDFPETHGGAEMANRSALEVAGQDITADQRRIAASEAEIAEGLIRGETTAIARADLSKWRQSLRYHLFARDLIQAAIKSDLRQPPET